MVFVIIIIIIIIGTMYTWQVTRDIFGETTQILERGRLGMLFAEHRCCS